MIFDNSPPDGSPGVLLAFLEGGLARELGTWPAADRRAAVLGTLTRLFGPRAGAAAGVLRAELGRRGVDPRLLRLPTCRRVRWTAFGRALRPPIGPLHWAGAEYADRWSGYMDGAVRSGEAAAAAIVRA